MTSPPAQSIAAAVADMAPTSSNNEALPIPDLTAAEASTPQAADITAPSLLQETDAQGDQGPQDVLQNGTAAVKEEIVENDQPNSAPGASIPQNAHENEPLSDDRPVTVQELAQMEALNALLAYAHPSLPRYNQLSPIDTSQHSAHEAPSSQAVDDQRLYLNSTPYLQEADEARIRAYAMLEFPDGQFYMNTYSIILGRDLAAARAALRRDAEEAREKDEQATPGEPQTPVRSRRDGSRYTRSVISESGGILRDGDDSDSDERTRKRRLRRASRKSKSTGSSSRRNSLAQPNGRVEYQAQPQIRRHAPDSAGAVPVDPASLRPSPHDCPLVGIHPPAATAASGYKAISRQHVKIAYNPNKSLFEAEIIGRNGAFVDEQFYYHAQIVELKSGSRLQIGGVVVRFILPDVAIGETGAEHRIDYEDGMVGERYSEGGKEMSFDFEDTPRDGVLAGDSSEDDGSEEEDDDGFPGQYLEDEVVGEADNDDNEGEDGENSEPSDGQGDDGDEEEEDEEPAEEIPPLMPVPPKRRGPGRPPKNGVMSKREQQLAKKLAQQKAKTIPQPPSIGKNKVGRPRKHPRPETPPIKPEKRKYTKRKPKDPDAAIKREGSQDDDRPAKDKKDKKAVRPPRSPSPTFNEADLTPEQLAKPQANYVTLIHEALTSSPTGQMSLPQIYRAIQRKYPFFVLKCNTNGWQSSVRHNLSQHHAFRKVERDGKGWMWAVVDGVSIEKEKKRRPSPSQQLHPGHMHQQIYRAGPLPQHMVPRPPGMMGPPPGYPMNGPFPADLRPGQPQQYTPPSMNGFPLPGTHPRVNGQYLQSFGPPPPMTQPVGPQSAGYSSPYAPKLTSDTTPPQGPSNSTPEHTFPVPAQPQPGIQQQARPSYQLPPQLPNENIALAIGTFKTALTASLKGKSNNAEAVVTSAINRVLGITTQSTVPGDPHEEKIMAATRAMLNKLPGSNVHNAQFAPSPQQAGPLQGQPPSQPLPTPGTGDLASTQPPANQSVSEIKPTPPFIVRPSFSGQGITRTNGTSGGVPRPPMMTPGMARTKSGSPVNTPERSSGTATSSASPAPIPAPTSASGAAPGPVTNGTPLNAGVQKPSPSAAVVNENGKRPLDDAEDLNGRDFKRLNTAGPTPLKA